MTDTLAAGLTGRLHRPGSPGFAAACGGFDLSAIPTPDLALEAHTEADVCAAVRYASAARARPAVRIGSRRRRGLLQPRRRPRAARSPPRLGRRHRRDRRDPRRPGPAPAGPLRGSLYNFTARPDGAPVDARQAFTEPDLSRLVDIKSTWDPQDLFRFTVAIAPTPPGDAQP